MIEVGRLGDGRIGFRLTPEVAGNLRDALVLYVALSPADLPMPEAVTLGQLIAAIDKALGANG